MVTDFVEHIGDAVDTLERARDFSRRRLIIVKVAPSPAANRQHAIDACLAEMQAPEGLLRRRFFVTRREAIGLL